MIVMFSNNIPFTCFPDNLQPATVTKTPNNYRVQLPFFAVHQCLIQQPKKCVLLLCVQVPVNNPLTYLNRQHKHESNKIKKTCLSNDFTPRMWNGDT